MQRSLPHTHMLRTKDGDEEEARERDRDPDDLFFYLFFFSHISIYLVKDFTNTYSYMCDVCE